MPTYEQVPNTCPFAPAYTLVDTNTGSCPPWIFNCSPVGGETVSFGTTDDSLLGTYSFRVECSDTLSAASNIQVEFDILLRDPGITSITIVDPIPDQVYTIGFSSKYIDFPDYTWDPSSYSTTFAYPPTIISGPSFVTISGWSTNKRLRIRTSDSADAGQYTVTIRTTETESGLYHDETFNLGVGCVTSIDSQELSLARYYIGEVEKQKTTNFTP